MMNYGIFTHIYVLQCFNAKEAEKSGKISKKWVKQESEIYCNIILQCRNKTPR